MFFFAYQSPVFAQSRRVSKGNEEFPFAVLRVRDKRERGNSESPLPFRVLWVTFLPRSRKVTLAERVKS